MFHEIDAKSPVAAKDRVIAAGRRMGLLATALLLPACGSNEPAGGAKRPPPLVVAAPPVTHRFITRIEAVGTARANEQVTLSSPVTERIERLYFTDGGLVRRGQVVAVLAQAEERAALAGARAEQRQATAPLERVRTLSERGFATGVLLDQQVAAAQRARSQADDALARIGDRVIRAPFTGYASLRTISEGAVVANGSPIVTISDVSRIKLDFTVPETALSAIRSGQPIVAVAAAYPSQPFRGVVQTIDPVIDPATRAASVRAILPNPGARLKSGMLLTVAIEAGAHEAMAVPELSVIGEGAERYVFVVGKDGKAVRTPVRVGARDSGLVEVSGLPADAQVIGEGVVKVTDGARVRVQPGRRDVAVAAVTASGTGR